jgi:hypothetical protein
MVEGDAPGEFKLREDGGGGHESECDRDDRNGEPSMSSNEVILVHYTPSSVPILSE